MAADSSPFWRFSLDFYRRPGVPEVCLQLQDAHGVDVNLLLFALWQATERRTLSVELPIRSVFEARTVAAVARQIERSRRASAEARLEPVARDGELALSFAQQRLWFLEQLEPGSAAYHLRHAMRISGALRSAERCSGSIAPPGTLIATAR